MKNTGFATRFMYMSSNTNNQSVLKNNSVKL